jgi:hypothetical protein
MVAQLGGGTMPSKAKGQRPNRKLLGTYSATILAAPTFDMAVGPDGTVHLPLPQYWLEGARLDRR